MIAINGSSKLAQIRIQAFDLQGANLYSVKIQMLPGWTRQLLHWSTVPGYTEFSGYIASAIISSEVALHVDALGGVERDFRYADGLDVLSEAYRYAKRNVPVREIDCALNNSNLEWFCTAWSAFPPPAQ